MPSYEFRCNDTGRHFEIHFKRVADYAESAISSPFTGSNNVTRIIRRVALQKGGNPSFEAFMSGDEGALAALEDADPQTMARGLRAMAEESGADMGAEFHEAVSRLEAGQSPAEVEAALPPIESD